MCYRYVLYWFVFAKQIGQIFYSNLRSLCNLRIIRKCIVKFYILLYSVVCDGSYLQVGIDGNVFTCT